MHSPELCRPHAKSARITDVAELAGVSPKSVSRVINNELHVSRKLRIKVEAAIRELNYVPDTAARSLAGSRSFTVGVLFDNPSPNYTIGIMEGAYRACVAQGYHLRIDHLTSDGSRHDLIAQMDAILRNSRTDGFLLTPPLADDPQVLEYLDAHDARFVRIAPAIRDERSPFVFIDDAAAAAEVAQCLWDAGHRSFGFVGGPARHSASTARRSGFLNQLQILDPALKVVETAGDFSFASGIQGGSTLLASARRPTAIFAANDDMAAGVMVACGQAGLKLPDDVSLVGFDDSWIASSVWPYLTSLILLPFASRLPPWPKPPWASCLTGTAGRLPTWQSS
jgi:LacI family transcriptional regulator